MKHCTLIFLVTLSFIYNTAYPLNIDVYGVDDHIASDILKKYSPAIEKVINKKEVFYKANIQDKKKAEHEQKIIDTMRDSLYENISKDYNASYVKLKPIHYPTSKQAQLFVTLDIVTHEDLARLAPIHPHEIKPVVVSKATQNLLTLMKQSLDKLESSILHNKIHPNFNQANLNERKCPNKVCIFDFKSKHNTDLFKKGAEENKLELMKILQYENDESLRPLATLLLEYLKNPHEIINTLLNYVDDANESVRNNAMRVIATTMIKAKIYDIPLSRVLKALNFPATSDRNKASVITFVASLSQKNHQTIIKEGGRSLLKLLRLKQPNNHDHAYFILKNISGKNFGEYDLSSWEKWLDQQLAPV